MFTLSCKNALCYSIKTTRYGSDFISDNGIESGLALFYKNQALFLRTIFKQIPIQITQKKNFCLFHWQSENSISAAFGRFNQYNLLINNDILSYLPKTPIANSATEENITVQFNQALDYHQAGELTAAIALYKKCLIHDPNHVDTLHYYGLALCANGNPIEGISLINKALELNPNYAEAYNNLGFIYDDQGQIEAAMDCYKKAIAINPHYSDAYCNLGGIYQANNNFLLAIDCYQHALLIDPNHFYTHYNLGLIYQSQSNFSAAINHYQNAIKINPQYFKAYINLGAAYQQENQFSLAEKTLKNALAINTNHSEAYLQLGLNAIKQNRVSEALAYYQKILSIDKNNPYAHFNLAIAYLLLGDYLKGFAELEWRWPVRSAIEPKKIFPTAQEWRAQSLQHKTLLLYFEQGVGDAIQYIRYVTLIKKQYGGTIIVQCPRVLISLFSTIPDINQLIAIEENLPAFDYYLSLLSLPWVLKTRLETIPRQLPYLFADKKRTIPFFMDKSKYHIGFNWAGNPAHENDKNRSIAIEYFSVLTAIENTQFYSLQLGNQSTPLSKLTAANPIIDLGQQIAEFADTAAIVSQLDLIICVDTALAHLSGALNKETWILLPFAPDFRWLLTREDSPWYPNTRLFRQPEIGNWQAVFEKVKVALLAQLQKNGKTAKNITSLKSITYDINAALQYHQSGQWDLAKTAYQQLLKDNPNHALALHYLGLLYHQQGQSEQAIDCLKKSLLIQPHEAIVQNNLGIIYREQGQLEAAIACYEQALLLQPDYAAAHYNKGHVYQKQTLFDLAILCYEKALSLNPNYTEAYYNLGLIFQAKNKLNNAMIYYEKALVTNEHYSAAHLALGQIYVQQQQIEKANVAYQNALRISPDSIDALLQLALIADKQNEPKKALLYFNQILEIDSENTAAHYALANHYAKQNELSLAQSHYEKVLAVNPKDANAHSNLGTIYARQQQIESAIICFRTALTHDEKHIEALANLGNIYIDQNDFPLALIYLEKAFAINPHHTDTLNNLGFLYKKQNKIAEAISYYQQVIAIDENYANAHANLALAALAMGQYELGWQELEWRFQANHRLTPAQQFPNEKLWQGESLPNKTILLYAEQGLGDAIHFIRYVELVEQYVPTIIVQCASSLHRLFRTLPQITQLIDFKQKLPHFDVYFPLMSLPRLFNTQLKTIPAHVPYLQAQNTPSFHFQVEKTLINIGIVWVGNPEFKNDKNRSIPLNHFQLLTALKGVQFYSLQVGNKRADLADIQFVNPVIDIGKQVIDFADTAAVISQLDLVISVDTSVAHLAGALNKPTWVLLPFSPDWRWLLEREDSPWYPSIQLFRQSLTGDWNSVFQNVKQALFNQFPIIALENPTALTPVLSNNHSILFHKAQKHHQAGQIEHAQQIYRQLLIENPNNSEALHYFGLSLHDQGDSEKGIIEIEKAVAIHSSYKEAYNNLGLLYHELGQFEKAIFCYEKAIALDNQYADAHYNLSLTQLLIGNYEKGWQNYEWRWLLANVQEPKKEFAFAQPWQGENLRGKTIFLYAEQGAGDAIQFVRYVEWIVNTGGIVIVQCSRFLKLLFKSMPDITQVFTFEEVLPTFDFYCPLLSLPWIIKTRLNTIPIKTPYLFAPPAPSFSFAVNQKTFNIGFVWAGNPRHKNDKNRSIAIEYFESLTQLKSIQFYSLQMGNKQQNLRRINFTHPVIELGEKITNFADTAAIIAQLDLIISVDTAVAHLAGALNKPIWLLLPFVPDWRWLLKRDDSPWYPTMQLFRQSKAGDWENVFLGLKSALEQEITNPKIINKNNNLPNKVANDNEIKQPEVEITVLTDAAFKYHQTGQLEQAKQLYQKILTVDENNITVLHYLGLLLHQLGNTDEAISLIKKAVSINPDYMLAYNNLGIIYLDKNQFDEAIACYQRVIELNPNYPPAHYNRGSAYHRKQDFNAAITCYEKALFLHPNYPEAHYNLGLIYQETDIPAAIACYEKTLAIKPDYVQAHYNLGTLYLKQSNYVKAIFYYQSALTILPTYSEAECGLGNTYLKQKDYVQATTHYEKALALSPQYADAFCGLGTIHLEKNQFDLAIAYYEKALAIKPAYPEAQCNLGLVYSQQNKPEAALFCYQKTLEIDPHYSDAHCALANSYLKQNNIQRALIHYENALTINPTHADAHWNLAFAQLLNGDYEHGWQQYEWRWAANQQPAPDKKFPLKKQWLGENLSGKTILIYAEQGLGDAIQFIRYIELVAQLKAKIIVQCQPSLRRLFSTLKAIQQLITPNEIPPHFDVFCPLLSLPYIFKTTLQTIPAAVPYLIADKKTSFSIPIDKNKLNIGFVWAGNPHFKDDKLRSLDTIDYFQLFAQEKEIQFYSLYVGERRAELKKLMFANPIIDMGEKVKDFLDTALVIAQLDLIITTDTSVAHLAGALNKPTWVLLAFSPDWRWLLQRDDSPWYPSMRLFRQPIAGDWDSVFIELKQALSHQISQIKRPNTLLNIKANHLPIKKQTALEVIAEEQALGFEYQRQNKLNEAIACYQKILTFDENNLTAQYQLGNCYYFQDKLPEAIGCYQKVLAMNPFYAEAHNNLGSVYQKQGGDYEKAITCYEKALQINPNYIEAYNNLSSVQCKMKNFNQALYYAEKALNLNPNYAGVYNNMGAVYFELDDVENAIIYYEKSHLLDSQAIETYSILGHLYTQLNKLPEAMNYYRRALKINPNTAMIHWQLALATLLTGDYETGWQEYEWRWQVESLNLPKMDFPIGKEWRGEHLAGKTILLYTEQGLGDAIQFIRYVPLLAAQYNTDILIQCSRLLKPLLVGLPCIKQVISDKDAYPYFDFYAPLMSLPCFFKTRLNSIPAHVPYLKANKEIHFPLPLNKKKFNIGFVWAGNPHFKEDKKRSIQNIEHFQIFASLSTVQFYSLYVGERRDELKRLNFINPIIDIGSQVNDFADTATVINKLDLVITTDTSVAHLAGALNKETWLLLAFAPDWRWLLDREDSPWYPSLNLFRQTKRGDWAEVFQRVKNRLETKIASKK